MPRYQNNMCECNLNCGIITVFWIVCIKYHLDVILNIYILARPLKTTHFKVKVVCQASWETVLLTVKL